MTILVYVRPWKELLFRKVAEKAFPDANIYYVSEHKGIGNTELPELFYNAYRHADDDRSLDTELRREVIRRCRLLRELEIGEAERLIVAMGTAINQLLDQTAPTLVLSLNIDSYILDILCILGEKLNIPFFSLHRSMLNGYFQLSSRGEYNFLREPDEDEVNRVLEELLKYNYTPFYLERQKKDLNKQLWIRWAEHYCRYIYFSVKRNMYKDPLNFHDWASQVMSKKCLSSKPSTPLVKTDWSIKMSTFPGKVFYFPIQVYPECSIDYWCDNPSMLDYENVMPRLVKEMSEYGLVCLKEHPAMLGRRSPGIYRQLETLPNVLFIPTDVPSLDVLDHSDAVVVWTGSPGFEAALRGKAVISVCKPYYASGRFIRQSTGIEDLHECMAWIDMIAAQPITRDEQAAMVAHLLSNCLPGHFIGDDTWDYQNPLHSQQTDGVATALADYVHNAL